MYLPRNNFLHLTFSKKYPKQGFKGQVYYSKMKEGENNVTQWFAHLHHSGNIPAKHQLHKTYDVEILPEQDFKVLLQGPNQSHTMMLYTYIPPKFPYQVSNFFTL